MEHEAAAVAPHGHVVDLHRQLAAEPQPHQPVGQAGDVHLAVGSEGSVLGAAGRAVDEAEGGALVDAVDHFQGHPHDVHALAVAHVAGEELPGEGPEPAAHERRPALHVHPEDAGQHFGRLFLDRLRRLAAEAEVVPERNPGTQYQLWLFGESWLAAWLLWTEDPTDEFLQAFEECCVAQGPTGPPVVAYLTELMFG